MGADVPANQATRRMAPASPVFAGMPAPTGETGCPWQRLRACRPSERCGPRQCGFSLPAHPARCGWRSRPGP
ncbi:hypothetical protein CXB65_11725 [Pseudomonas monteilii]|uniref:Uncharacterized protein n=1 Tax=Pseudomonas monteilii TaxID=76759 RepID=A0A2N1IT15_9PSED|nr:hypothetical protein CXB65_11725 [Pseudomonas monteilii]RPD93658.1 hypothetical protein EGN69_11810 [Pseudomonas monteilii]